MADINNVVLVGRLTRDAELKYTNTGIALSKTSLAINRRRKVNNQWVEEANFFDVAIWGKTAEALQPYLKKGKQIAVHGELRQNRWEKDGKTRSRVEVVSNNIQLLGGGGGNSGSATGYGGNHQRNSFNSGNSHRSHNQNSNGGYQGSNNGNGYNNSRRDPQPPTPQEEQDWEDDIPF